MKIMKIFSKVVYKYLVHRHCIICWDAAHSYTASSQMTFNWKRGKINLFSHTILHININVMYQHHTSMLASLLLKSKMKYS